MPAAWRRLFNRATSFSSLRTFRALWLRPSSFNSARLAASFFWGVRKSRLKPAKFVVSFARLSLKLFSLGFRFPKCFFQFRSTGLRRVRTRALPRRQSTLTPRQSWWPDWL